MAPVIYSFAIPICVDHCIFFYFSQDSERPDDTSVLLEKEFEDFFEDSVHKSAGPVVFVSKTLGMLPVIWTEDEEESECKSYFNLYTFLIFIGGINN